MKQLSIFLVLDGNMKLFKELFVISIVKRALKEKCLGGRINI